MGKLLIFEGLDGSGKGTQTALLCDTLRRRGVDLRQITFPDYESDSSALVRMYLSGRFGDRPDDVNAYASSTFFAVDRFASYKTVWGEFYRSGGLVVSDRYTTSNAVHQCSKLPPMHWDGFLNWLFDFEYKKLGIPEPDAVVYLAVDVKSPSGCWPSATTATPPGWTFRKRIPNTWPAPAPRPNTAPARWAGGGWTARGWRTGARPCARRRRSTPRYLRSSADIL